MIRWERRGEHVGVATIDRQEKRNALNAELCDALRSHLEEDRDLRAVVITGSGSAFCAGADLVTRFADGDPESGHGGDTFRPAFDALCDAIDVHPAPVIAAVNGAAMGAGMQLAVACDLRVVAPNAKLAVPAGKLGVHLSARNIARLGLLVGQAVARDVLLGGRTLTSADALRCGIAQRVDKDTLGVALEWADEIAALAPLTISGHKEALRLLAQAQSYGPEELAAVDALEARAFASEDLVEGMTAFAEKRPPRFQGR